MKKITLLICAIFLTMSGYSQDCSNTAMYGSANVSTPGIKTVSTCNFLGEYSTISGVSAGYEYEFTGQENASGNLAYITVRTGTSGGTVVASGTSPLTITAPSSDNLYVHWNASSSCTTTSVCSTTTATCITCATIEDCEGVQGGSAVPGSTCDDGNAGTINDVYDTDCNCAGVAPAVGSVCTNAIAVVCNADPAVYSSAASNGTNTTTCSMGNNGLWFSFMGTGGGVTVNSTSTFDHEMSINSGLCEALINIGCSDSTTGAETFTIASSVLNQMYYVYIAHYASGNVTTGDITISIVCATPPACTAPTLALAVQDVNGNAITECLNLGSSYYALATLAGGSGNTSYNLTANGGAVVEVSADGSVVLGPFNVGTNLNVSAVGVQDGDCNVSATANSPALCPPLNIDCANAITLVCNADPITFTSVGSTATNTTTCTMGNNGIWFSFMGTGGDITVNSTATFDHEMSINSGSCGSLVNIACKDGSTLAETYTITSSVVGETYYVYVARYSAGSTVTGNVTIDIDCATPPACTTPTLALEAQDVDGNPITECLNSGSSYYVLATLSGGAGNTSYNVSANGAAAVEVVADSFVVLGPFTVGTNVTVVAIGAQDGDCEISATKNSPVGCPPSNDGCDGAIALQCGVQITGSTANATASGLTAACGGFTSSSALDLFYSFEADGLNSYVISLNAAAGNSFDGILFVYSGTCGSLVSMGCSDEGNPEEIELIAPEAGTYIVRIFRYTTSGNFTLDLECTTLSINENNRLTDARLYPNPLNDGTFYIYAPQLNGERVEVNITDVAGRQIFSDRLVGSDNKISVSVNDALSSGMYLVTLKHAGETHTFRLVKE